MWHLPGRQKPTLRHCFSVSNIYKRLNIKMKAFETILWQFTIKVQIADNSRLADFKFLMKSREIIISKSLTFGKRVARIEIVFTFSFNSISWFFYPYNQKRLKEIDFLLFVNPMARSTCLPYFHQKDWMGSQPYWWGATISYFIRCLYLFIVEYA